MSSASRPLHGAAQVRHVVSTVLLAGALSAIVYLVVNIALFVASGGFPGHGGPAAALYLAAAVYLTGHGLRILRLALLIGGWRVGFRDIATFHLMTAAASLTAPLKLGEIYRAIELTNLTGSFVKAIAVAWTERTVDAIVLLFLLILALAAPPGDASALGGVTILVAAFIMLTAVTFFIVPDNLRRLSLLIIRRYGSLKTVSMLRVLDRLRRAILEAPHLVHGKVASVATLTVFIWICELLCFVIAIPALGGSVEAALETLLTFLSALTRGETLLSVLESKGASKLGPQALSYFAATQVPLALIGLVSGARYARSRPHV